MQPKAVYQTAELLNYIEASVEELNRDFPAAFVVLAGDLNQLHDQDLVERTGLTQIVQSTDPRGQHPRPRLRLRPAAVQHRPRRHVRRQKRPQGRRRVLRQKSMRSAQNIIPANIST